MSICPGCGEDHDQWEPSPEIERDLAAMIALVLAEESTLKDFAVLVGNENRASALLLRAVQTIAQQAMQLAHIAIMEAEGDEELDPRDVVIKAMQDILLHYANDTGGTDESS